MRTHLIYFHATKIYRLYHAYLRNRSDFKYKAYRYKLKYILNASKKLYYSKYFSDNLNNRKNKSKKLKKSFPSNIVINNKSVTDTRTIADKFNEYFAKLGYDLARCITHVNKSYKGFLQEPLSNS